MAERRSSSWLVIALAAVAILSVAIFWLAWRAQIGARRAAEMAAEASAVAPRIPRPVIPDAPRIPSTPTPAPK